MGVIEDQGSGFGIPALNPSNIGALIIWGPLYYSYNYNKEPPQIKGLHGRTQLRRGGRRLLEVICVEELRVDLPTDDLGPHLPRLAVEELADPRERRLLWSTSYSIYQQTSLSHP